MVELYIDSITFVEGVKECISEGKSVTFKVTGRSMRPFIEHLKDSVIVSKAENIKVGDVILAYVPLAKQPMLHRVISIDGDNIIMRGDGNFNTEKTTIQCVIAKAIAYVRHNDKKILRLNSFRWKLYSYFWMHTFFIRRYLLAIYRITHGLKLHEGPLVMPQ